MRKILAIITFLLFLLLLWWSHSRYQECCGGKNTNNAIKQTKTTPVVKREIKTKAVAKKSEPLVYDYKSSNAITNDLWDEEKNSINSGMTDGKTLRITGPYFEDEGKEMGILRAKSAFSKLGLNLDSKRVEYDAKLVDFDKSKRFAGTNFSWLTRNDNITEVDNKVLIYFPTNSTKKISNVNIINYLKGVAKSLKGNNKKVALSGHTDNRGNAAKNKTLALRRANSIKNELVRLGVAANRISATSYGEERPIATNDTKAGQQKNRRVELEIK